MIIALEKGIFGKSYEIVENDTMVAHLGASSWKEKATVEVEGKSYRFEREGAISGSFLLLEVENVLAYAQKPSAFRDRFQITHFTAHYELRKPSIWKNKFELEEDGRVIGTITPTGFFRRKILIDLPEEMPLVLRIFIFWLALIIWKREQNAAAV